MITLAADAKHIGLDIPLPTSARERLCPYHNQAHNNSIESISMDPDTPLTDAPPSPSIWRWVIGFLMVSEPNPPALQELNHQPQVGMCWGLTTPFMRKAAVLRDAAPKPSRPYLSDPNVPWVKRKIFGILYAVVDLLKSPKYAMPLLLNVTGSVWFFLLIGQAGEWIMFVGELRIFLLTRTPELSLTVPITNSLAFLFTVLGEWWADGKVISRDTWIGMGFVLGGIALCVQSKTS